MAQNEAAAEQTLNISNFGCATVCDIRNKCFSGYQK